MAQLEIDREIILIVPFSIGAMISLGLIPGDILQVIDLSDPLLEGPGAADLSLARLLSIAALAAVVINRDESFMDQVRGLGAVEAWIVWATVGMIVAPPLMPTVAEFLSAQPAALIALMVQTMGFGLVSYIN